MKRGSPEYLWPHDHKEKLSSPPLRTLIRNAPPGFIKNGASEVVREFRGRREGPISYPGLMQTINGEGSEVLLDKYQFIEMVRNLGYAAQHQVLISSSQSADQRIQALRSFPCDVEDFIFKPLLGSGGKGITRGSKGVMEQVVGASIEGLYTLQEKIPIKQEYRYVLYQDHQGNVWRIMYEKTRPIMQGENKPLWQMIKDKNLPLPVKLATAVQHTGSLFKTVPDTEEVQIGQVAVPKRFNTERFMGEKDKETVDMLDQFMNGFVDDLEESMGHKLPLLCFDLGVTDPSTLHSPYDEEKAKKNIYFFECQLPFTTFGYYLNNPESLKLFTRFHGLIIEDFIKRRRGEK